jgi:pimeloyl-ACP methyl ester carboxylesterase
MESLNKVKKAPLIFVPGIMGSNLFKKGGSEPIWPAAGWGDKGHFKPTSLRDLTSITDKETSQNEPLFPVVYSELLRYFENMGYILGQDFWIFPYDWTQSNRKSGRRLEQFIQDILSTHPQWHQVDVVSHSMGGLVTRAAARLYSAPIRRTVYITSPHFGSPKVFFILHPKIKFAVFGNFFRSVIGELAWRWYLHRLAFTENINLEEEIKSLACQLDSIFELLPDRFYFEQNHLVTIRKGITGDFSVSGLEATYYSGQCKFPSSECQDRVKEAMAFKEELGATLPGQENLVIYSDSEKTIDQIIYPGRVWWRFGRYKDSGQKGDSVVPVSSAALNNPTAARRVQGTHQGVPNSLETSLLVKDFLDKP